MTKVTRFIYDNEEILLELDGSNNITARYTHGPGIDEPLVMERGGASFFYHADGLGSITEITDATGALKQQYTYSSFGKIESQLDPNFIQPYTFTAREFDTETRLYHYRKRDLDPTIGRFLQKDPIGFLGGFNFYVYVQNSPANFADPSGLQAAAIPAGPFPVPLVVPPQTRTTLSPAQTRDLINFIRLFDPRPFGQFLAELIDKIGRGEPVTPEDIKEAAKGPQNVVCEIRQPTPQFDPSDPSNQPPKDPRLKTRLILAQILRLLRQVLQALGQAPPT